MGIDQHVQWLLEGVMAWNARRIHQDFIPYLQEEDLATILRDSQGITEGGEPSLEFMNLSKAVLRESNLSGTSLLNTNLTEANLAGSDLTNATLWLANLQDADLGGCNLENARLGDANLVGANLSRSRFWQASMQGIDFNRWENYPHASLDGEVTSINDVLHYFRRIKDHYTSDKLQDMPVFYFRGESNAAWDLCPSVMRKPNGNGRSLRNVEGEMLVALMTHRAEDFVEANSALDQMMIARHHTLPTRLLDVTSNPLVALFNASEKPRECPKADGHIHVFAVPTSMIKQFNSDTVSVIANFARLRRGEQNLILGKTEEDTVDDVDPHYGTGLQLGDDYSLAMNRLYQFIRLEKPSFQDRINPLDLLRVIVVEPQKSFERIRAQSGAFLISAFHERFEESKIQEWIPDLPTYHHYTLTVPYRNKRTINEDLATFNITRETMLPGLEESAKAVRERYGDTGS